MTDISMVGFGFLNHNLKCKKKKRFLPKEERISQKEICLAGECYSRDFNLQLWEEKKKSLYLIPFNNSLVLVPS